MKEQEIWVNLMEYDIKLDVSLSHQEAEAPETGPDALYPGCAASTTVTDISIAERDESFVLTKEDIKTIYEHYSVEDDEDVIIDTQYVNFKLTVYGDISIDDWSSDIIDEVDL